MDGLPLLAALLVALPATAEETGRISMGDFRDEVLVQAEGLASGQDVEDGDDAGWVDLPEGRAKIRDLPDGLEVNGKLRTESTARFRGAKGAVLHAAGWEVSGELVVRRAGGRL